jgi:hypothetical protein
MRILQTHVRVQYVAKAPVSHGRNFQGSMKAVLLAQAKSVDYANNLKILCAVRFSIGSNGRRDRIMGLGSRIPCFYIQPSLRQKIARSK